MAVPALVDTGVLVAFRDTGAMHGWAIPTATDIAFALGVLAIFGRGLPVAIRTFLLTLAVVDDLLAIIVIAIFYTETIHWWSLTGALACVALFAWHVRSHAPRWFVLLAVSLRWDARHARTADMNLDGRADKVDGYIGDDEDRETH